MKKRLLLLLVSLLLIPFGMSAQTFSVKGNVKDASGEPIIGATVRVVGQTTIGTASDADGNFTLDVPADAKQLEVSFVGMTTQTVAIVNGTPLNITFRRTPSSLTKSSWSVTAA